MKRKLSKIALCIISYALCTLFLASCQKEDSSQMPGTDDGKATFNVMIDYGVATRAGTPPETPPTRYIMEVYEVATSDAVVSGDPQQRFVGATSSFTAMLKDGSNYACLFFADYGTPNENIGEYDAEDLKAVSIRVTQAETVAFGGSVRFTYDRLAPSKPYLSPTLTHNVAQVNYKQTEDLKSENNSLKVVFPKTFALNLDGNVATEILESSASVAATHNFTNIAQAPANTTLGTSYIIADGVAQTVIDITATFNNEVEKNIANVPFQCNYKTNIKGAYSNLYETDLSVTCDDEWEAPEHEASFGIPSIGDYYYNDNTFSTTYISSKTVIGIVFWIDPNDPAKGKFFSIDDSKCKWSTENVEILGARSETDGAANTLAIKNTENYSEDTYPAVWWCDAKNTNAPRGISWYLPAKDELLAIYYWHDKDRKASNARITSAGGNAFNETCSSSTENSSDTAIILNFFIGFNNVEKMSELYFRAVSAF